MGTVYIFRGKAATGKTTLSNMLAEKLCIPVLRKDDIFDALKISANFDSSFVNAACYNILYAMMQINLHLQQILFWILGLLIETMPLYF